MQNEFWQITQSGQQSTVQLRGQWLLVKAEEISALELEASVAANIVLDGSQLERIDTAGAMLILSRFVPVEMDWRKVQLQGFQARHLNILEIVRERLDLRKPPAKRKELSLVQTVGKSALDICRGLLELLSFLGQACSELFWGLLRPATLRVKEFFVQLEHCCLYAVPIVALVTFLIGVVIAYLYASQMEKFGANIFIADAVTVAMLRELSPLIVAIIVAGRSGSAFTAHIGTMKLNEEIDALTTLGLSPLKVLVVPRVLALIIAMPLLVFVGDLVGVFGGVLIADFYLGVTPSTFFERLDSILKLKTLLVGLCKAPVFALFIAVIGCKMGLSVENNARSVGLHTTSTVVQSIVSVILLNAAFALILVELKI